MVRTIKRRRRREIPQPLLVEIWNVFVPDNFKPPSLSPTAFNTQIAIIEAIESLKCKLLSGTHKEATLHKPSLFFHRRIPRRDKNVDPSILVQ